MIKQLFFIGLLSLLILNNAKAQNWGGGADDDVLSFGFSFQSNASEFKLLKTANWKAPFPNRDTGIPLITSDLTSISSTVTIGTGAGGVVNLRLTKNTDLRFTPAFVLSDRKILYTYNDGSTELKKNNTTLTELPLFLKLKSDRIGNLRAYMLGGLKYSYDIASRKKIDKDKDLYIKKSYLSYEAGLGMDFYFAWFKMSPELKVSYSLKDMLIRQPNPFDSPIEKAKLRSFTFSLIFE